MEKWLDKFQDGGKFEGYTNKGFNYNGAWGGPAKSGIVINDEMGQWAHPGEITRIPSNDITMEGVDYPVLGISDTGDKKLMKPGGKYKFKGVNVTEFPMKNGNFINKKQSGGWLDNF